MQKTTFLNILFFSVFAILVNSTTMAQTDSVWLEAECGTVGSLWNIVQDNAAANKYYVTIENGTPHNGSATSDIAGHITYSFNITAGDYALWGRFIAPTANDDSFYVRIDDGSWKQWNQITNEGVKVNWGWTTLHSFDLTAGAHTLTVAFREDGTLLDKLYLTKGGDTPTGEGDNVGCTILSVEDQTNEVAEILMYPNPVSEVLSIYLPGIENESTTLSVYNTNGSLVKTITAQNGDNKVDIKNLSNGLYFISFNINNKVYNRKFIKK